MRIVLIDKEEHLKVGGVTTYNSRFYKYLKAHGHQATILRFSKSIPKESHIFRIPYYLAEPRTFIVVPSEKTLSVIKKHLVKIKPDIVYTCSGLSPLDFFLPQLCHTLNIPLAAIWHADYNATPGSYQILTKSIFLAYLPFCRQLDMLHVFSDKLKDFYLQKGMNGKKILVLPNGVDPIVYRPEKSQFAHTKKIKKGILFLGRLTLQKNPEVLIKTFLSLNPDPETKLVIVGHGDQEGDLRNVYNDHRIIFTGAVSDEQKKIDIMRACQIFVLPSRFEGMSLALLEAMSLGLACIATDVGANGNLLENTGILLPEKKLPSQLGLALKILLDYPDFAFSLGRKAREKIIKDHSQEIIFSRLLVELKRTVLNFKNSGSKKTAILNIDKLVIKKLNPVWQEIKKFSSFYLNE